MFISIQVITILLTLIYVGLLISLYRGLFFLKPGENNYLYRVSVVIAARNEEQQIGECLQALVNQTYPSDCYEIIIVDDRSIDSTANVVRGYNQQYSQIRLIQVTDVPRGMAPKKNALTIGINVATGDIILTTDADCTPAPGWIQGMVKYFEPEVGLVAGFSPLEQRDRKTLFSELLTLDSLSLAAVAAGSFGMGTPVTCNGRNLAYRKETFQSVNGFARIQHLISGDDDLLLQLIHKTTDWKIKYAIDPGTLVRSRIPAAFRQFADQRIRHASKGRYYSAWLKLALITVYLLNLDLLLLMLISILTSNLFFMMWPGCWFLKGAVEFLLLCKAADLFNYKKVIAVFPLAMILHVPYIVIFGFWGQLGKFRWKDETFKAKVG